MPLRFHRKRMSGAFTVLGAGLVSRPLIEYLSREAGRKVVVASGCGQEVSRMASLFAGRSNVETCVLDASSDGGALQELVNESRVVVSLLPAPMHGLVADAVLASSSDRAPDLVTASYKGDMVARHEAFVERGVRCVCLSCQRHEVGGGGGRVRIATSRSARAVGSRRGWTRAWIT